MTGSQPDQPQAAPDQSVFDGRLSPGVRCAVLVVDVCEAYLQPGSALYGPAFVTALGDIARVVAAARGAGRRPIFTRVVYQAGGIDGGLFYRKIPALRSFVAGSPLGNYPPEVAPRAGDVVIVKQYASAFFGTSLAATLTTNRIDSLILTGFSTSGCVRATAVDAIQHGFAPFVVDTACADRRPETHAANLFDLQAKYAEVIDITRALAMAAA